MKTEVVNKGGVGICGWMFLIFLTLKLTGYIGWSWWWVTAPLWGPFVLSIAIIGVIGAIAVAADLIGNK